MKRTIFTLIFFCFTQLSAQTWSEVNTGVRGTLAPGVTCMQEYNGDLYVGGSFSNVGSPLVFSDNLARYNAGSDSWSTIGDVTGMVKAMAVFNGELFIGGSIGIVDGMNVNRIARWNGSQWLPAQSSFGFSGTVNALQVWNGALYAAGDFSHVDGTQVNKIAKYDPANNTWLPIGGGTPGLTYNVRSMTVWDGKLVVGSGKSNPARYVTMWDGSNWVDFPAGGPNNAPYAMESYNGMLFVGGIFSSPAQNLCAFDGTNWITFGNVPGPILDMQTGGGRLYMGGSFSTWPGLPNWTRALVSYNGSNWATLGAGASNGVNNNVESLGWYDDCLFAGGIFTEAGGVVNPANHIARFCQGLLPVRIESIEAGCENGEPAIHWKVAEGGSLHRFEVERSRDALEFETIGDVIFTPGVQSYSFTHSEQGTAWYRLRMVDANGRSEYSRVVTGTCGDENETLQVWPVPARDFVHIRYTGTDWEGIEILDAQCRTLVKRSAGEGQEMKLDLSALPRATYVLRVYTGSGAQSRRLVLQ